jgi:hypothetical protein
MMNLIISMCWTPELTGSKITAVSAGPPLRAGSSSAPASVAVRPQQRTDSNDCSVVAVRDRITADFDAIPFLGALTCSATIVVAGSIDEVVFTYTVGRSGIADSGWLKLCFRYYSDWDLQTADPGGRDFATARLVSRSLVGG